MDRQVNYYGALVRAADPLLNGQNAMVGLGKLAEATFGTITVVDGFTCLPTAPPSLTVTIGPGQIYEVENLEASAISLLAQDTHNIVKQGIQLDPAVLTLSPPPTVGQSYNVLIEATYSDSDVGSVVLNYYNAANPTQPYAGPGNNGQAQATVRKGIVSLKPVYGIAATSGQQVTPSPDAGYVGLFVITLSYGQTAISTGNIVQYANAPFLDLKLPQVRAAIQAQAGNGAVDTGTANAMVLTLPGYTPSPIPDFTPIRFRKGPNANSGATTVTINGTTYPVQTSAGAALTGGELAAGASGAGMMLGGALRLSGSGAGASSAGGATIFLGSATAGSATALTTTLANAPSAAFTGMLFTAPITTTNGASPTIDFGYGAKPIVLNATGVAAGAGALPGGIGYDALFQYDGTSARLVNAPPAASPTAVKAWVNFDGTTTPPTIRASYNVSSVTRLLTGQFQINFATPLTADNCAPFALASTENSGGNPYGLYAILANQSVSPPMTKNYVVLNFANSVQGNLNPSYAIVAVSGN